MAKKILTFFLAGDISLARGTKKTNIYPIKMGM